MSDIRGLYQEVILDHNKNPRNFRILEGADHRADGYNPLCGDRFSVFLKMANGSIEEISFQGNGCAISKASASLMTSSVKGKTSEEVRQLVEIFLKLVTGETKPEEQEALGKLVVFSGVSEFPVRVKCASLAWRTLQAALERKVEPVSTE